MAAFDGGNAPAGPQLIRALNEQLVLAHIRQRGELTRAELARITRLSKPTVSLTLTNLERAGLVRTSGLRTGAPGPAGILYQVRPEAGYVLGLDVGSEFLRGAVCDLSGTVLARATLSAHAATGRGRVAELVRLSEKLYAQAGITGAEVTQAALGTPGVYHPGRDTLTLTGALPGWEKPEVLASLRAAFGATLMVENDVDAAALAEREYGHGRERDSFAFVSIGTGIGMGLVLGNRLHRGAHGAAGEIGYLPLEPGAGTDLKDARKRGSLEAAASAAGVVRAARRAGLVRPPSSQAVFAAAAAGDERAAEVVLAEARLVAQAIASVVAVVDPELVVLGGGIGQADGFLAAVSAQLPHYAPVQPELRVSALGDDAVTDGCLAAGLEAAWQSVTAGARQVGALDSTGAS
jgi:predicted NBD/HSP70 family sugar kinase